MHSYDHLIMEPYAKPGERRTGENRPQIEHVSPELAQKRRDRQSQKQQVAAERRAIKKSARRHLQRQLERELDDKRQ